MMGLFIVGVHERWLSDGCDLLLLLLLLLLGDGRERATLRVRAALRHLELVVSVGVVLHVRLGRDGMRIGRMVQSLVGHAGGGVGRV